MTMNINHNMQKAHKVEHNAQSPTVRVTSIYSASAQCSDGSACGKRGSVKAQK